MNNLFLRLSQRVRDWLDERIARDPVIQQWESETIVSRKKTTQLRGRFSTDPITGAVRGDYPPRRQRRPRTPRKDGA